MSLDLDNIIRSNSKSGSEYATELVSGSNERKENLGSLIKDQKNSALSALVEGGSHKELVGRQKSIGERYASSTLEEHTGYSSVRSSGGSITSSAIKSKSSKTKGKTLADGRSVIDLTSQKQGLKSKSKSIVSVLTERDNKTSEEIGSYAVGAGGVVGVGAGVATVNQGKRSSDNGTSEEIDSVALVSGGALAKDAVLSTFDEDENLQDLRRADQYRLRAKSASRAMRSFQGQRNKAMIQSQARSAIAKEQVKKQSSKSLLSRGAEVVKGVASRGGGAAVAIGAGGGMMLLFGGFIIILLICCVFSYNETESDGYGDLSGDCLKIAQFFREKEVDDMTIAAICGNIYGETEHDTSLESSIGCIGMCQWYQDRAAALKNKAHQMGKDWKDIDVQLEYLWQELQSNRASAFENTKEQNKIEDATIIFCEDFEQPYTKKHVKDWEGFYNGYAPLEPCDGEKRVNHAKYVYEQLQSGDGEGGDVVARAKACIGIPYVWGAVGPDGYDCSGLVSYCLTGQHKRIGTTATFWNWQQIKKEELKAGDVLVYDNNGSGHTGLYIGDGKVIHAAHNGVEETTIELFESGSLWGWKPWRYVRYAG